MRYEMRHTAIRTDDGLIHIQNHVGTLTGQHHVHTTKSYERWLVNIAPVAHPTVTTGKCLCGLSVGDVREYDGKIWHSEEFAAG
jgi:hypothetical protein